MSVSLPLFVPFSGSFRRSLSTCQCALGVPSVSLFACVGATASYTSGICAEYPQTSIHHRRGGYGSQSKHRHESPAPDPHDVQRVTRCTRGAQQCSVTTHGKAGIGPHSARAGVSASTDVQTAVRCIDTATTEAPQIITKASGTTCAVPRAPAPPPAPPQCRQQWQQQ